MHRDRLFKIAHLPVFSN